MPIYPDSIEQIAANIAGPDLATEPHFGFFDPSDPGDEAAPAAGGEEPPLTTAVLHGFGPEGDADSFSAQAFAEQAETQPLRPRPPYQRSGTTRLRPEAQALRPPSDVRTERALLGACLLDATCIQLTIDKVKPEDFFESRHKALFGSMARLYASSLPTDGISVLADLESQGELGTLDLSYLVELGDFVGNTQSVEHYAKRIAGLARVRLTLTALQKVQTLGYSGALDPDEFIGAVETEVASVLRGSVRQDSTHISDVVTDVWSELMAAKARGGEMTGISTGYRGLDHILHGLHRTDLIVLAARPAMGKTAFALNLALEVARRPRLHPETPGQRNGVLLFSLEMGKEQLVQRLLSSRAGVELTRIRTGQFNQDEEAVLIETAEELSGLTVMIDDTPGATLVDIRARAKRMAMQHPVDLVVVDYLQLMNGSGGKETSREQVISENSRGLKHLAKELKCTVLALSQLNRSVERREDKRPMMSDLRESGAIEQDADIISFIFREHVYDNSKNPFNAELIIAKHRAGDLGTVELHFDGKFVRFSNRDQHINDEYVGDR